MLRRLLFSPTLSFCFFLANAGLLIILVGMGHNTRAVYFQTASLIAGGAWYLWLDYRRCRDE